VPEAADGTTPPFSGSARPGCPLPPATGVAMPDARMEAIFKRFRHWVNLDVFKRIFDAVSGDPDMEHAMIDGTIVKVHRHGQGSRGGLKARP
jgi:transposase